jgi:hydrogenase-4 component B
MIGLATHQSAIALLGFLAALYHALNHSFFKGLLFLGAGAVEERLHTSNLNEMGGLGKRMPWTALAFLIGVLGVSAIPPLNGFVSEWFTFQALFAASLGQVFAVRAILPLCAALLALGGALAAMVAIKMYASAFMGPAHNEAAQSAGEVPNFMLGGMGVLGAACILLGVGAPLVTPYLTQVVTDGMGLTALNTASGTWVYPADPGQALLSTPLTAILLLGFLTVPFLLAAFLGRRTAGSRSVDAPWACGYGYSAEMSVTAGNFDQPVKETFKAMYLLRAAIQRPLDAIGVWAKRPRDAIARAEPGLERLIKEPTIRTMDYLGRRIQALQMGDIRMYCLYIIITLAVLLIVIFR